MRGGVGRERDFGMGEQVVRHGPGLGRVLVRGHQRAQHLEFAEDFGSIGTGERAVGVQLAFEVLQQGGLGRLEQLLHFEIGHRVLL